MPAPVRPARDVPADGRAFVAAVDAALDAFLRAEGENLAGIVADGRHLTDAIASLSSGGKRMRASLCYWGYSAVAEAAPVDVVQAGLALELFQTAALIHDDVIDRSDTRRSVPSVHRRFEAMHAERGWALDGGHFGVSAAVLAGDLCLSFSEQVFGSLGPAAASGTRARLVFDRMRMEVLTGQYLDVLEEVAGPDRDPAEAVARARTVSSYKSARYSVERPLVLGAALAGADTDLVHALSAAGLPLGEAFQLRDDVLGVFGDPALTGKPAGDDLREGKRTVLIGLARQHAPADDVAHLEDRLGRPDLDAADVARLRAILTESGALRRTEELITQLHGQALAAIEHLPVPERVRTALTDLADRAVSRQA
ncbi:putative polyprenyl synthetase [Tersicoccus solisilvae]|uniref:Polyprenyl synthetase n=1 Tax=Tersicoccus solisilvae TaxID=1882339 RepID=A0ABQ1PCP3_9MICC|nr:polyprenyl synthetase family protein [Tersicoccus solisilvae]GGC94639.1 putative polyprenyl synthetase [Tersicoccus solisilvae]